MAGGVTSPCCRLRARPALREYRWHCCSPNVAGELNNRAHERESDVWFSLDLGAYIYLLTRAREERGEREGGKGKEMRQTALLLLLLLRGGECVGIGLGLGTCGARTVAAAARVAALAAAAAGGCRHKERVA